jgi:hypothetical protein
MYPSTSNFGDFLSSPTAKQKQIMSPPPSGPAMASNIRVRTSYVSPFLLASTPTLSQQQQTTPKKVATPLTRLMQRRATARLKELESLQSTDVISNTYY